MQFLRLFLWMAVERGPFIPLQGCRGTHFDLATANIGACSDRRLPEVNDCILDIERRRRTIVFAGIFRRANWGLAKQGARVQHDISALDNDRGAIPKPQRLPGRVEQTWRF